MRLKQGLILIMTGIMLLVILGGCTGKEPKWVTAFCGSASKPAMEEAAAAFEKETGVRIYLNFGGSGTVLAQMMVSQSGDLYIPGSPDYMELAKKNGVVDPDSVKIISYLVPAILVQKGNPKKIKSLEDLAWPGIIVGIGNPEAVCVGLYTYEILEYNDMLEQVQPNIVTHAESCARVASLIALKSVDAVIGWRVFSSWNDETDVVYLEPRQIPRLAYVPGAVSTFSNSRPDAGRFLDFLASSRGQEIFRKWGYLTTESEALKYAPGAQIGGEYQLPASYRPPVG